MAITKTQREARKGFIGSSDVPRIMAGDRVRLVVEKLGLLEPAEEDEPNEELAELQELAGEETPQDEIDDPIEIKIGALVESKILDAYEREYRPAQLVRSPDTIRSTEYPWLGVHLDAEAIYDTSTLNTEVKSVGWYRKRFWGAAGSDDIPEHVMWQVQDQMLVTGLHLTHVPVCFIDEDSLRHLLVGELPPIHVYIIPSDATLQAHIIQKTREVWQYVEAKQVPPPDNPRDLYYTYRKDNGTICEANDEILGYHTQLMELRGLLKQALAEKARLDFQIKSYMQEAAELWYEGHQLATWKKAADGQKLDKKTLAHEQPQIFKQYQIPTVGSRRFLPKEIKVNSYANHTRS